MNDNVDTSTLLANLKSKANPEAPIVEATSGVATAAATEAPPAIDAVVDAIVATADPEESYQQYTASRVSTCLITPSGKRVNFTNYQYYTKDAEIIAYLDQEIKRGLIGFTKGKVLTVAELNPEAAKRREIIEEFKASQEGRDFGSTKPESERSTALSSDQVAN